MASGKIRGITVEIGGDTTKLGKAIGDVEKQSNSLKGELKQVEKLLKMDPGNADLMAQKQEILTRAVSETSEKLKILKEAQSQVEQQFKDGKIGEDQYRAFQREIIKTENELSGFRSELDGTGDDLKKTGDSAEQSSDGFTIMKGALADMVSNAITSAITAIGDLVGALFDLSEATEEYRSMQAKLEGSSETFGYSMDFAKSKYEEFYKYLGDDQMATNAVTNLMGLGTSTENVSKLAEGATAVWASYGDSIPIESLTESMNETIKVGKVTGTFADTINWCKDSNNQLNKSLDGNKKAQKAFNDALEEGLPVEDAFNEALSKITDEQERADVVAKFLNDTYGESKKAYDETAGSILDANEAELQLKETQAQLGETVEPVNTALTNMKNQALEAIAPLVEKLVDSFMNLYEWLQKNPVAMQILTAVVIALGTAFTILAGALAIQGIITGVTKAFAFLNTTLLANPIVLIIAAIAALIAAFIYLWNNCESFREFWKNLWSKIKEITHTIVLALKQFFTVMIPDMLNKVVTWFKSLPEKVRGAISSMVEKVKTIFNNVRSKAIEITTNLITSVINWFKQLPGKIWNAIVSAVTRVATWGANMKAKAVSAVTSLVSSVISFMKQLPGKIWNAIVGAVSKVATWGSNMKAKATSAVSSMVSNIFKYASQIPGKIRSAIQGAISTVSGWGSSLISTAGNAIRNMVSNIISIASGLPGKFISIGQNIIDGIKSGISGAIGGLYSSIKSSLSGLVNKAKDALGINSPSKVFADTVGIAIPEGIAKGITDNVNIADGAVRDMTDDIVNQVDGFNGATINRQLTATFKTNTDKISGIDNKELLGKLDGIYDRLSHLQIVLDTGTLVGETIDKIDASLADKQLLSARGV